MSAALALITLSAALTLPLTRNTSLALLTPTNITSLALEVPAELDNSVRYLKWPKVPYSISLDGTGHIGVFLKFWEVIPFRSSPMINVRDLQLFLQDFANNFRQEYPVPGFIPRDVDQYTIDVTSHTRWTVWIKEAMWQGRLPTAVALAAIDALEKELGKYGPASILYAIQITGSRLVWSIGGFNIHKLTGTSLNDSLSNENDNLQTA